MLSFLFGSVVGRNVNSETNKDDLMFTAKDNVAAHACRIWNIAIVLLYVSIVSGCAIGSRPDQAYVEKARVGKVVMLEAPPMTFHNGGLVLLPIKSGMLPVTELKVDNKNTGTLPVFKVDSLLADELARQLSSEGRPTVTAMVDVPLPTLKERSFSNDGQNSNWKQASFEWYHSDKPSFNYRDMFAESDAFVIEVSIDSVSVNVRSFNILLRSKLVDPKTGSIKGKTLLTEVWQDWSPRGFNPVPLKPGEPLFQERLQELLRKTAHRNLAYFGLVKPADE